MFKINRLYGRGYVRIFILSFRQKCAQSTVQYATTIVLDWKYFYEIKQLTLDRQHKLNWHIRCKIIGLTYIRFSYRSKWKRFTISFSKTNVIIKSLNHLKERIIQVTLIWTTSSFEDMVTLKYTVQKKFFLLFYYTYSFE